MKTLYEYINEAVKVTALKDGYKLIELVSRKDVDCANLTKEQFYDLMMEDLEKAQDEYSRLVYDERKRNLEAIKKRKEDYIEKLVQARYKRKSKQDEYREKLRFDKRLTDYDLNQNATISFNLITKIDNGHPADTLSITAGNLRTKLDGTYSGGLWDELQKSEWWKIGQGWSICYTANKDGFLPASRSSEIVILMPEDKMAEKKARQEALDRSIASWYKDGGYMGD